MIINIISVQVKNRETRFCAPLGGIRGCKTVAPDFDRLGGDCGRRKAIGRMGLEDMGRRELQAMAKKRGIRANQKTAELIEQLRAADAENEASQGNRLSSKMSRLSLSENGKKEGLTPGKSTTQHGATATKKNKFESPLASLMRRASGGATSFLSTPASKNSTRIPNRRSSLAAPTSKNRDSVEEERKANSPSSESENELPPPPPPAAEPTSLAVLSKSMRASISSSSAEAVAADASERQKQVKLEQEFASKQKAEPEKFQSGASALHLPGTSSISSQLSLLNSNSKNHRKTVCPSELSKSLASRKSLETSLIGFNQATNSNVLTETPAQIVDERIRIAVETIRELSDLNGGGGCTFDEICDHIKQNPSRFYDRGSTAVQLHRALRVAVEEETLIGNRDPNAEIRFSLVKEVESRSDFKQPSPVDATPVPAVVKPKPVDKRRAVEVRKGRFDSVEEDVVARIRRAVKAERIRRNQFRAQLRKDSFRHKLQAAKDQASLTEHSLFPSLKCMRCKSDLCPEDEEDDEDDDDDKKKKEERDEQGPGTKMVVNPNSNWELRESRSKPGQHYFYNRVTHETTWKNPCASPE